MFEGPYPSPGFKQQVAGAAETPLIATISGEVTTSKNGVPVGAVRDAGLVKNVFMSVGASGKDDSNTLSLEADVQINGTTCLTTKPKIAHVSGEASQQKTTKDDSDTGITQAVMSTANAYSPGDVITVDWSLARTASPTTEIANAALVIELEPSGIA